MTTPPVIAAWPGDFLCDEDAYRAGAWLVGFPPPGTLFVFDEVTAAAHCASWNLAKTIWKTRFRIADGSVAWRVPVRWIRTQLLGTLGGVETFSVGLNYTDSTSSAPSVDSTALQNVATVLAAAYNSWLTTDAGAGIFPTDVVFTKVAASYVENTGSAHDTTLLPSAYANVGSTSGVPGSGGAASLPYECSCCVTLETGYTGRGGKGRFYLPPFPVNAMTTGGKYSSAFQSGGQIHALPSRVMSLASGAWLASVVSKKHGVARHITKVSVGTVPDSQRRRRANQTEARSQIWP